MFFSKLKSKKLTNKPEVEQSAKLAFKSLSPSWFANTKLGFSQKRPAALKKLDQAVIEYDLLVKENELLAQIKIERAIVTWELSENRNKRLNQAVAKLKNHVPAGELRFFQPSLAKSKVVESSPSSLEKLYRTWIWDSTSYFRARSAALKVLDEAVKDYVSSVLENSIAANIKLSNAIFIWKMSGECNARLDKAVAKLENWLQYEEKRNCFEFSDARHKDIKFPDDYRNLANWWDRYGRLSSYKMMSSGTKKLEQQIYAVSKASSENLAIELQKLLSVINTWQKARGHQSDRLKVTWIMQQWAKDKLEEIQLPQRQQTKWPTAVMNLLLLPFSLIQLPIWEDLPLFC